jgi:transcriptional regulator with XRE-family HTH domain
VPDAFRDALRRARQASGMPFRRFALLAGFSESHLRSVENGHRAVTGDVAAAYDRVLETGGAFALACYLTFSACGFSSWARLV